MTFLNAQQQNVILKICGFQLMFHMQHINSIFNHIILHAIVKLVTEISNKLKDITYNYTSNLLLANFRVFLSILGHRTLSGLVFCLYCFLYCSYMGSWHREISWLISFNEKDHKHWPKSEQNKHWIIIGFIRLLKFCLTTDTYTLEKYLHMYKIC